MCDGHAIDRGAQAVILAALTLLASACRDDSLELRGAHLVASVSSLNFDTLPADSTWRLMTVQVENRGDAATNLVAAIESVEPTGFEIDADASSCLQSPRAPLAPGESCTIAVILAGTYAGAQSALLSVGYSAGERVELLDAIPLNGVVEADLVMIFAGGVGTVTAQPGGQCRSTSTCELHLFQGTVHLTATPDSGYAFHDWGNGNCSEEPTCVLPLSSLNMVLPRFVQQWPQ